VLSNGSSLPGPTVDFQISKGSGLLAANSVTTDGNGYAATTLQVSSIAGDVQVSACVKNQPVDNPCLTLYATTVPLSALQLIPVSGNPQIVSAGQNFAPVVFQVTDSTGVNPVLGANVAFQAVVARLPSNAPAIWIQDTAITGNPMPLILSSSQSSLQSDGNGLVAFQPSVTGVQGPVVILGTAAAGVSTLPFSLESVSTSSASSSPASSAARSSSARSASRRASNPR
jgi:hypothetical protein